MITLSTIKKIEDSLKAKGVSFGKIFYRNFILSLSQGKVFHIVHEDFLNIDGELVKVEVRIDKDDLEKTRRLAIA